MGTTRANKKSPAFAAGLQSWFVILVAGNSVPVGAGEP
jgi:hypothetical protein